MRVVPLSRRQEAAMSHTVNAGAAIAGNSARVMSLMLLSPGSALPHAVEPAGSIVASPRLASAQIAR
jgi:hypothetical protein